MSRVDATRSFELLIKVSCSGRKERKKAKKSASRDANFALGWAGTSFDNKTRLNGHYSAISHRSVRRGRSRDNQANFLSRWIIQHTCRINSRRLWSCFHRPGAFPRPSECKGPSIHKLVSTPATCPTPPEHPLVPNRSSRCSMSCIVCGLKF